MTDYDRILLSSRWSELDTLARQHQAWAEARRELAKQYGRGPANAVRGVIGLRGRLRRSLKGARSID